MKLALTFIFTLTILSVPALTYAQIVPCDGPNCTTCDFVALGQNLLTWFISVMAGVIALVFAIGGIKMVMAGGNEGKITEARGMMTNAIIGFVILLSAWLVVDTIMKTFVKGDYLIGPWNEIECVAQPELVDNQKTYGENAKTKSLFIPPEVPFNTEISTSTELMDSNLDSLFNTELKTTTRNYTAGMAGYFTGNGNIANTNKLGTSIPIVVPSLDKNYYLTIRFNKTNDIPNAVIYSVLSGTRDFNEPYIDELTTHMVDSTHGSMRVLFKPEDSGRVIYLNYKLLSPSFPQDGGWRASISMTFRVLNEEIPITKFSTEISQTYLADKSMTNIWGTELSTSIPQYMTIYSRENADLSMIREEGRLYIRENVSTRGTSLIFRIPQLDRNYFLGIEAPMDTRTRRPVFANFSGYRDFSSPALKEWGWGVGVARPFILTPEDSGRILYLNYRLDISNNPTVTDWLIHLVIYFSPTNQRPADYYR